MNGWLNVAALIVGSSAVTFVITDSFKHANAEFNGYLRGYYHGIDDSTDGWE